MERLATSSSSEHPISDSSSQEPSIATLRGVRVEHTKDALLIFEACRQGILPRVSRRLSEAEKKQIVDGTVFVFDEKEARIKRWTDGMVWTPSRIVGNFLFYRELSKKIPLSQKPQGPAHKDGGNDTSEHIDSLRNNVFGSKKGLYFVKPNGLIKRTISLAVPGDIDAFLSGTAGDLDHDRLEFLKYQVRMPPNMHHQHLISYFKSENVKTMPKPEQLSELAMLRPPIRLLKIQKFRRPLKIIPNDDCHYDIDLSNDEADERGDSVSAGSGCYARDDDWQGSAMPRADPAAGRRMRPQYPAEYARASQRMHPYHMYQQQNQQQQNQQYQQQQNQHQQQYQHQQHQQLFDVSNYFTRISDSTRQPIVSTGVQRPRDASGPAADLHFPFSDTATDASAAAAAVAAAASRMYLFDTDNALAAGGGQAHPTHGHDDNADGASSLFGNLRYGSGGSVMPTMTVLGPGGAYGAGLQPQADAIDQGLQPQADAIDQGLIETISAPPAYADDPGAAEHRARAQGRPLWPLSTAQSGGATSDAGDGRGEVN